jgi:succinate-semialdehyde dehydrogenase/glutarate-semialdehyde dehydrogenase
MDNKQTQSINPATGKIIGHSKIHSLEELNNIVERARQAQINWEVESVERRRKKILKVRDFIVENADRIAEIITRDNGKVKIDALAAEVIPAAMAVSYYTKKSKLFLKEKKLHSGNILFIYKRSKIVRVPFGVIGIISPWNYPFAIPFSEVIMGLLAGNAVVLKTATETQMVGQILKDAINYAGLPDNIFNYVNMPGSIAGEAFINSGLNKIFFTGSVNVGKFLMEKAAKNLTPLTLELGGNDAMIVCEDADPFRAAMGAVWGGFQNSGQSCGGVERIYVHEKIYDEFMTILKTQIENLRVNYGEDLNSDMGCMTTEKQIHTVNEHIEDALKKGAKIFAKSKVPADNKLKNFLPAVVLTDVNHEMILMRDETFGPVVGVMKFKDYDEAVALANDSYLGLTGSVWSKNKKRAESIGKKIKAGVISINDHLMSHGLAETPWGGFKQSGIGRTHGELGFDEMTQPMVVVHDYMPFQKRNLWWHPYDKKLYDGLRGILSFLYGKNIDERIFGLTKLMKIFPRVFKK